jgi:hypothetical protein
MPDHFALPVVDGLELPAEVREALRPGELMRDRHGRSRRLPRFFYEIPSWDEALETDLSANFQLWEFLNVDVLEAEVLRMRWPRYIPCAVTLLAAHLELFRNAVDTYVHIAANGGYRSPSHRLSTHASPHCWGAAANIYRVGDDWLTEQSTIVKYNRAARKAMPSIYARPYGHGVGEADDHVHLDIGFVTVVPHAAAGDEAGAGAFADGEDDVTGDAQAGATE